MNRIRGRHLQCFVYSVWTATIIAFAVDSVVLVFNTQEFPGVQALGWVLLSSLALAGPAAVILSLSTLPAVIPARGPGRFLPSRISAGVAALLPTIALVLVLHETLSGPWIASQPWVGILRLGGIVVIIISSWGLARMMIHVVIFGSTRRLAAAGMTIGIVALMAWVNHEIYPRLYPAVHLALCAGMLLGGTLIGAILKAPIEDTRGGPARFILPGTSALLAILFLSGHLPGGDPATREVIFVKTTLSSQIWGQVAPAAPTVEDAAPTDAIRAVFARKSVSSQVLDRVLPARRNLRILVITLDALRADHVGHLGYSRATTPHLDALSRESVVFENTWCQHPSSHLSMASLFRGLYPTGTDIWKTRHGTGNRKEWLTDPTLSSILAENGRNTIGVTSIPLDFLQKKLWFLQPMFGQFENHVLGDRISAETIANRGLDILENLHEEDPWFLWLHFFDPHFPYRRHEEHGFGSDPMDRYDEEIAHADIQIGRVIDAVRKRPDADRTVIVVHSDHGEEFGDHGGTQHHSTLYEEQIRVPLLIHIPGLEQQVTVEDPAEIVDIVPTLLELADLPIPPQLHGRSLLPLVFGNDRNPDDTGVAFAQFREPAFLAGTLDAVRADGFKLIHNTRAGTYELFNLHADRSEQKNLAASQPEDLLRMRGYLAAFRALIDGRPQSDARGYDQDGLLAELAGQTRGPDRIQAIEGLLARGRMDLALPHLARALEETEDEDLRIRAIRSVANSGDDRSIPLLKQVVSSSPERVRLEGIWALASLAGGQDDVMATMDQLTGDQEPSVARNAVIAGGLHDKNLSPRVAAFFKDTRGVERILAAASMGPPGAPEFHEAVTALGGWGVLPPHLDRLVVGALCRQPSPETWPGLYLRTLLGRHPQREDLALITALSPQLPDAALPILRHFAVSPDRVLRARALNALEKNGHSDLADVFRQTAEDLYTARMTLQALGKPKMAMDKLIRIHQEEQQQGFHDWGIAFEIVQAGIIADRRAELIPIVSRIVAEAPNAPPSVRIILERMEKLVRSFSRTPRGTISFIDVQQPQSESRPGFVTLRLDLESTGGGLPGGLAQASPSIRLWLTGDGTSKPVSVTDLPIPPAGVLPGESWTFVIPWNTPLNGGNANSLKASVAFEQLVLVGPESHELGP